MSFSQNWNLETIFTNGSQSNEIPLFLNSLKKEIGSLHDDLINQKSIKDSIICFQGLNQKFEEASSFVSCLLAQDVSDKKAELLQSLSIYPIYWMINWRNFRNCLFLQLSKIRILSPLLFL
jgi:oligoendopeptidase F